MNRLIIVGNGFDLAHNMKTSYYDFILSYFKKSFLVAQVKGEFKDELLDIIKPIHSQTRPDINQMTNLDEFLSFREIIENNQYGYKPQVDEYRQQQRQRQAFNLDIKSKFLNHLITKCRHHKWVDIENEYYAKLKQILESKNREETQLQELNESLLFLICLLNTYLAEQKMVGYQGELHSLFGEKIRMGDIINPSINLDILPSTTLLLNFNYTDTLEYYRKHTTNLINQEIIYIHGKVNDKDNPIIFGFGDEHDNDYAKLESATVKGFFNYIKSFWYFKTSNYHNLIRFIESDDFQVYILGHSCGLSDRTMLKMIFEHNNCKSIKIFYHETKHGNNYTELTQEISRHFKDKGEMRKKIVSFDKSSPMPQVAQNE